MSRLTVRRSAERELIAAAAWYNRHQDGLGREFLEAVGRSFRHIEETPLAFPQWRADAPYRKYVVKRFPYVVFYVVTGSDVCVVAVAHGRRKPGYWVRRRRR